MNESATLDLTSDAFAQRFGRHLAATRSKAGRSTRALARASDGGFTHGELKALEQGTVPLHDDLIERVSELYGCDLGDLLPTRLPVAVGSGVVAAGGVSIVYLPGDADSLLEAYLKLVRTLRRQRKSPAVDLRREDVEALAEHLQLPGEAVVDRLAALMGAGRNQRAAMAGLFASGAVVIGLVGTAVAGGSGITSRHALTKGPLHDGLALPGSGRIV